MSFKLSKAINPPVAYLIHRSDLESRWDPNYYRCMREFKRRMEPCPYPIDKLKRSVELVQYGISERATEEVIGVPMLRMLNLQDDTWDVSDLKYIDMSDEQKKPFLLEHGDILFNRTNSKEWVGKCGVFDLPDEYVFASYLIRVRVRHGTLLPAYVTAFLSSSLGRVQIDAVSRQIAGMTNINAEEIRDLLIPDPGMQIQKAIVKRWGEGIRKRDKTLEKARDLLAGIDDLLLDALGITPTPSPSNTLENRIFQRHFSDLSGGRWDPLFHQADIFDFIRETKSALVPLRKYVDYFTTGFPAGRSDQVLDSENGVIQIRPTNLSEDRELSFRRNIYISPDELTSRMADVLRPKEVLFNNTNSQEMVGKTVWFNLKGDYFSSNHITRIGTVSEGLDPHYLTYILNLYQCRKVFFKLCTNWNNQSGVGPDVLGSIPIPLPSLKKQQQIATRLESVRKQAHKLRNQARTELDQAKQDIEILILGQGTKS